MKNVLILGVNGFIGHHLSTRILDTTDWGVYGMDMYSERIAPLLENPRLHFFEGDITINREWIEYHVKKCRRRGAAAGGGSQRLPTCCARAVAGCSSSTSRPTCGSCGCA